MDSTITGNLNVNYNINQKCSLGCCSDDNCRKVFNSNGDTVNQIENEFVKKILNNQSLINNLIYISFKVT